MNLLADALPTASPIVISNGVLYLIALIWLIDRAVAIVTTLRTAGVDSMPRAEIEKEHARINKELGELDEERRKDVGKIFDEMRQLSSSVSTSLNDVARCLGKLEGSQEFAHAFKETLAQLLNDR